MAVPLAHVIFVLDCSGSMSRYREETQAAFNTFVATLQKTKGAEIKLTLIEYRDTSIAVYRGKPIQDVPVMDSYRPNASEDTLYDAVHYAVQEAEKESRTNKTVICILCDGGDNASTHTMKQTKALVDRKRGGGYEFCFLAAGRSASCRHEVVSGGPAEVAARIGIPPESIIQYDQSNGEENKAVAAFGVSAWGVGAFSAGRAEHVTYTAEQKRKVGG